MDVAPVLINERVLVPVRFVAYALDADVDWNEATSEVTLTIAAQGAAGGASLGGAGIGGNSLTFAIGEPAPGMDVPAQIIDGRTFVPIRFISEFFGAEVNRYEDTQSVEILR